MVELLSISQVKYALFEIKSKRISNDRKYTIDPLIQVLYDLLKHNINDVPDFTSFFKKYGLKTKEIIQCISQFVKNYNMNNQKQTINWFKSRSWRQLKYYHKNFIIAKLAFDYEALFLDHFRKYAKNNFSNKEDIEIFVKEIEFKIGKIKNQFPNDYKEIQFSTESIDFDYSYLMDNDKNLESTSYENNNDNENYNDDQMIFY